jgi:hypothetical protein
MYKYIVSMLYYIKKKKTELKSITVNQLKQIYTIYITKSR